MSKKNRSFVMGGAILAVIAVVYFAFFYPPVTGEDAKGTIGAVQKYRAEQITEKDVVLEGEQSTEPTETDQTLSTDQPTLEMQEMVEAMAGVLAALGDAKDFGRGRAEALADAQAALGSYQTALKIAGKEGARERLSALSAVEARIGVVAKTLATYRGAAKSAMSLAKESLDRALRTLAKNERQGRVSRREMSAAVQQMTNAAAAFAKEGKSSERATRAKD